MSSRDLLELAGIIPALPLIGVFVLLFFGRRIGDPRAGWLASTLLLTSFAWSLVMFAAMLDLAPEDRSVVSTVFTWIPAGSFHVDLGFVADPLSITWCLLVTGVGSLIHLYSIGYMRGDPRFSRFFCYMNLFAVSMLVLVLADNFLLTFLGWEGVGLCSYLLISFWFERNTAAVAGKKAFVTNRVGDVGFLLAMFLMFDQFGSLEYSSMRGAASALSTGTSSAIALLLFVGAMGKSAQVPLHVWLTDAMEGPTPVSALIHAATMVTAGIFLVARAHPFFEASADAQTVVLWIGVLTAFTAGLVALVQPDIKRVLAYSTISQLGFMFLALGLGAYTAAVFHVLTHAFFKGALFLGAGSVIHGNADNQDMRIMGRLRRFMPSTAMACMIAWLAISGIPPFSGFWSKDEILVSAFEQDEFVVWVIGTLAAAVTACYMTRLIYLTFFGNARFRGVPVVAGGSDDGDGHDDQGVDPDFEPTVAYGTPPRSSRLGSHDPHESPLLMVAPLAALAGLAAIAGLMNLPFNGIKFLDEWLEPVFEGVHQPHPDSFAQGAFVSGVSVLFALLGAAIAIRAYRRGLATPDDDPLADSLGPAADVLGHAYYYDETLAQAAGGPGRRAATFLDRGFDVGVIDGAVNGIARLAGWGASWIRKIQDGFVRRYALVIAAGTVAILLYLFLRAGR